MESGAPVDPNGKLQRRERQVAEASRPRQLSAEEVAMLEEPGSGEKSFCYSIGLKFGASV